MFRNKKNELYKRFINDVIPNIDLISLQKNKYSETCKISHTFNLDFDDSYQCTLAKELNLSVLTMDKDFEKVSDFIDVIFL